MHWQRFNEARADSPGRSAHQAAGVGVGNASMRPGPIRPGDGKIVASTLTGRKALQ